MIENANELEVRLKSTPSKLGLDSMWADYKRYRQDLIDKGYPFATANKFALDRYGKKPYTARRALVKLEEDRISVFKGLMLEEAPVQDDFDVPKALQWAAQNIMVENVDKDGASTLGLLLLACGKADPIQFVSNTLAPLIKSFAAKDLADKMKDSGKDQKLLAERLMGIYQQDNGS